MALSITGMHCDACLETIKTALIDTPGILECEVRLGDAFAVYDEPKISRANILAVVQNVGAFDVSGFSTSP